MISHHTYGEIYDSSADGRLDGPVQKLKKYDENS